MKVINLYGGPGCGKSTIASGIFSELRAEGINLELVQEYIKSWAYLKRKPKSYDQFFIFSNQLHLEDILFQNGVDYVITDSPLLLNCAYAKRHNFPLTDELVSVVRKVNKDRKNIDIFLDRSDIPYSGIGRYESFEQAIEMDQFLLKFLNEEGVFPQVFETKAFWSIVNAIKEQL